VPIAPGQTKESSAAANVVIAIATFEKRVRIHGFFSNEKE
jgi:hypothetical protein